MTTDTEALREISLRTMSKPLYMDGCTCDPPGHDRNCVGGRQLVGQRRYWDDPNDQDTVARTLPAMLDEIDALRARVAELDGADQWQPIETAPERERIMVCGWIPPHGNFAGYWWWQEDVVCGGKAIESPDALYWHPIRLPIFPPSPPPTPPNMEASHDD